MQRRLRTRRKMRREFSAGTFNEEDMASSSDAAEKRDRWKDVEGAGLPHFPVTRLQRGKRVKAGYTWQREMFLKMGEPIVKEVNNQEETG